VSEVLFYYLVNGPFMNRKWVFRWKSFRSIGGRTK